MTRRAETLSDLLENNRRWARRMLERDGDYFRNLSKGQRPRFMWIGCSDSRVMPTALLGVGAEEVFVFRNIANLARPDEVAARAAVTFAVEFLRVRHIMVAGHTSCGGVAAALNGSAPPETMSWVEPVRAVLAGNREKLEALPEEERADALAELNVRAQVLGVASMPAVQEAWSRGQKLSVHGLMFHLSEGLLHDLNVSLRGCADVPEELRLAGKCGG